MRNAALAVFVFIAALAGSPSLAEPFGPAVAVDSITFNGPPDANLNMGAGLADMVQAAIFNQVAGGGSYADCDAVVVDVKHRDAVQQEQALQQSEYFDPATRVPTGQLTEPTHYVTGHVQLSGGQLSWFVEIRAALGGETIATVSGDAPESAYLDIAEGIAQELIDLLCGKSYRASGGGSRISVTGWVARIDAPFKLVGEFQGGTSLFTYTPVGPSGGTVSYVLMGSGVTGSGAGTFTMSPQANRTIRIKQSTHGCIAGMVNSCRDNSHVITLTPVKR